MGLWNEIKKTVKNPTHAITGPVDYVLNSLPGAGPNGPQGFGPGVTHGDPSIWQYPSGYERHLHGLATQGGPSAAAQYTVGCAERPAAI